MIAMQERATAVAALLGSEWTVEEGYHGAMDAFLRDHDRGWGLQLIYTHNHATIVIRCEKGRRDELAQWWPEGKNEITVAAHRSDEAMFHDIVRRLLPAYKKAHAVALAGKMARVAKVEKHQRAVIALHALLPDGWQAVNLDVEDLRVEDRRMHGSARVYPDSVEFHLVIPGDLVPEFALALQSYAQRRCEALARKGTGAGICDRRLNRYGACEDAARHVDQTGGSL